VQLRDGRATPVVNVPQVQYAIAREAIALVMPASAGSEVARQWYLATIASLQGVRNYGALLPHLDTARVSLAGDWRVWLWSGVAQENLASPPVQVAAEEQAAKIESPWLLYTRAEQFYRRAMEAEPGCAECWLRLARVHQLTNAADQSAALLARAEPKLETPELRYFAALFAGRAAEMLNKVPEARAAYERAMALFPRAQSPRLALADLAFREAEQRQAQSGVRTMFVAAGAARDADPWWNYDIALVAKWPELVGQLRKMAFALLETK
jgi:tetratricopeptide (TPR) repeat protein